MIPFNNSKQHQVAIPLFNVSKWKQSASGTIFTMKDDDLFFHPSLGMISNMELMESVRAYKRQCNRDNIKQTSVLDIPKDIFRQILSHLPMLPFSSLIVIERVCKQFREYALPLESFFPPLLDSNLETIDLYTRRFQHYVLIQTLRIFPSFKDRLLRFEKPYSWSDNNPKQFIEFSTINEEGLGYKHYFFVENGLVRKSAKPNIAITTVFTPYQDIVGALFGVIPRIDKHANLQIITSNEIPSRKHAKLEQFRKYVEGLLAKTKTAK